MYMYVIVQNENVNCTHTSVHRVQDLWRPDVHLWRSWWRRCTRLLSKCGQHTLIKTNLTSGMCCAYTCTQRVSKLFIVFREIDDEETSDTDGDREEVEDGSFARRRVRWWYLRPYSSAHTLYVAKLCAIIGYTYMYIVLVHVLSIAHHTFHATSPIYLFNQNSAPPLTVLCCWYYVYVPLPSTSFSKI